MMYAASVYRFSGFTRLSIIRLALLLAIAAGVLPLRPALAGTGRPDLTVSRIRALYPYPGAVHTTQVSYTVRNIGTARAAPFLVTVRDGSGRTLREFTAPALAAGQSRTYTFLVYGCRINHRVILDRGNRIRESSEVNNRRSITQSC